MLRFKRRVAAALEQQALETARLVESIERIGAAVVRALTPEKTTTRHRQPAARVGPTR